MAELVFNKPPRELHFMIDEGNVVTWKTLPVGEAGSTIPFQSIQKAEDFVTSYARRLGFEKRLVEEAQAPEVISQT